MWKLKLLINVLAVLMMLLISNSFAGQAPFQGCTHTGCAGKLESVYLNPNGTIQVPPMGNASSMGCTLAANTYLTLKPSHVHFNEMYSMMLTAHTASKDIFLRTIVGSSDCEIWYAVIY